VECKKKKDAPSKECDNLFACWALSAGLDEGHYRVVMRKAAKNPWLKNYT